MNIGRLGAVAAALGLTALASGAGAHTYNVDCSAGTVSGAATAGPVDPTTVLGLVLGTESARPTVSPPPAPGDIITISSICRQDVMVTTSGLTITNPTGPNNGFSYLDGVNGQLEIAGATGIVIDGIGLGVLQNAAALSPNDVALLYAHDGASATVTTMSRVGNSPLLGVLAARSSKVEVIDGSVISLNGLVTGFSQRPRDNGGIQARDNSTVVLGTNDGLNPITISSNLGDAVAAYRNSSIVSYSAQLSGNSSRQIFAMSASSAYLTFSATTVTAPSGAPTAIQAVGNSTLQIDGGVTVAGASGAEAISVTGGSALLLQGSTISTTGIGPVIEASSGSVIALAGGNTICNGTFNGVTCQTGTGFALQIDHVASLVQVPAATFGYTAAPDTVAGNGSVVLQSTADFGLGTINASPSLSWNSGAGGIAVSQNSSFRLNGGVAITGNVAITQGSNGFFNKSKGTNAVSRILCPFASIPASHAAVAGTAINNPSVTPFPVVSTNFVSTAANQCLSF